MRIIRFQYSRTLRGGNGDEAAIRSPKLRAAGALVLVSDARKEVETLNLVDGIWVTDPQYAVPLAIALRQGLVDVATVRQARAGHLTKLV